MTTLPSNGSIEPEDREEDKELSPTQLAAEAMQASSSNALLSIAYLHNRELRHLAYSITRCYEAVQNIMTDLYIRVLEKRAEECFHSKEHMRRHVFKVVQHLALDWRKRQKHRKQVVSSAEPDNHPDANWRDLVASMDAEAQIPHPVTRYMEAVQPHLAKLSKRQAEVFKLRVDGKTFKEIGSKLKIRPATAKKHLQNAVTALKQMKLAGDLYG